MSKANNKNIRVMSITSFWCLYSYFRTYFTSCSNVSVADLVITSGVISFKQIVLYVWRTSDDRSYLILQEIETKQCPSRAWRVLVQLADSWWFCLVLDGFGIFPIVLWVILFIWFIFSNYIRTIYRIYF